MEKLDPVCDGSRIISNIFKEYDKKEITDLKILDKFLARLIYDMKGLLIFDFLDSGNWDNWGSYHIDYKKGYVIFNWHSYMNSSDINSYIKNTKAKHSYPISISSIMVHFKDLQMEVIGKLPIITIRGYVLKEKEILNYFKTFDESAKIIKEDKKNFHTAIELNRGEYTQDCICYDTPIYSILIIPKDNAGPVSDSLVILFLYNYLNCYKRIEKASKAFNRDLDEDEICEKANTIRRIFEFVLKIECCFHGQLNFEMLFTERSKSFNFRSDYSDIGLGDLISLLKPVKNDNEKQELNLIVRLSNELSHDSGKPVTKEKGDDLIQMTTKYIDNLIKLANSTLKN